MTTAAATKSATARHTPFTIMGMSGLKPILLVSTGMAVLYTLVATGISGTPLTIIGVVLGGFLYWTLLEYILHRWVLHWEPQKRHQRMIRKCFPSHRPHHNEPTKERINVMLQLKITVYLSLVHTAILWLVMPLSWALALNAGILLGYQAYEYVHVACHHLPMRNAWARTLKRHHAIHHHRDETVNFGVTTTVWDQVFRTVYKPGKRPAEQAAAG